MALEWSIATLRLGASVSTRQGLARWHRADVRDAELVSVERRAKFFSAAGAEVLVLAAFTGSDNYEEIIELGDEAWKELFENLSRVEEIASRYGLTVPLPTSARVYSSWRNNCGRLN